MQSTIAAPPGDRREARHDDRRLIESLPDLRALLSVVTMTLLVQTSSVDQAIVPTRMTMGEPVEERKLRASGIIGPPAPPQATPGTAHPCLILERTAGFG